MALRFSGAVRRPVLGLRVTLRDGQGRVVAETSADLADLGREWLRWSATVTVPLDVTGGEGSVDIAWQVDRAGEWTSMSRSIRIYA
jgi:hypothetical protein